MTTLGTLIPFLVFASLMPSLRAQGVADEIERAMGGRSRLQAHQKYVISGKLDRVVDTPEGPVREVTPFRLAFDRDLSRFEFSDRTILRQGVLQQWWKQGGRRSGIRIGRQGQREVYLMPLWPVSQLKSMYRLTEANASRNAFQRRITTRRFVGKRNRTDLVELSFHPRTHLLAEAFFTTVDNRGPSTLITYEDYRRIRGLMVPSRVTRTINGNSAWIFLIESVDFSPTLRSADFDFEYRMKEVAK